MIKYISLFALKRRRNLPQSDFDQRNSLQKAEIEPKHAFGRLQNVRKPKIIGCTSYSGGQQSAASNARCLQPRTVNNGELSVTTTRRAKGSHPLKGTKNARTRGTGIVILIR